MIIEWGVLDGSGGGGRRSERGVGDKKGMYVCQDWCQDDTLLSGSLPSNPLL